ncbi:PAS domain-containing methyl-accepting chemotaxis protein [Robbsia sp. KACC 23696]|uniref:methyl-accepting chemotaxis protein n=1 Tax=Robbsia sp. KACC 23696 TaxID=3149231 RepID=UPI00325A68FA
MNVISMFRQVCNRLTGQRSLDDLTGQVAAIDKSQSVVEFSLDGRILDANENFCRLSGYSRKFLIGKHHRILVEPSMRQSEAYRQFWDVLGRGEFHAGIYKRVAANGREMWLQATYNPLLDTYGRPFKVVKYATDVTEERQRTVEMDGEMAAIRKAQLVAEFDLAGNVLSANDNFLQLFGYRIEELEGTHHCRFIAPADRVGADGKTFWEKLSRGEYDAGCYPRVSKSGRTVWLQATYNPIFDAEGRPFKVVKYATDVTEQTMAARSLQDAVAKLSAALRTSAANAQEASDMAHGASEVALRGGQVMDEVIASMREMKARAEAISSIVDVIDDIAFQTNLLALNASVEAAWAGEQGKNFAIVANEVRALAQRSADSAKDARDRIDSSVDQVSANAQLVTVAGQAMFDIVGSVDRVNGKLGDIRTAALAHSAGAHAIREVVARLPQAKRDYAA